MLQRRRRMGVGVAVVLLAGLATVPVRTRAVVPAAKVVPMPMPKVDGAEVFASAGCTQCHGPTGLGTAKGPSLRDLRKRRDADSVYGQIEEGGLAMPPFGEALDDAQITALVEFLRGKKPWPKK